MYWEDVIPTPWDYAGTLISKFTLGNIRPCTQIMGRICDFPVKEKTSHFSYKTGVVRKVDAKHPNTPPSTGRQGSPHLKTGALGLKTENRVH